MLSCKRFYLSIYLFFIAIITLSCQDSNIFQPLITPYNHLPVVTGIVITSETGDELGTWHNPSESIGNRSIITIFSPYPNPNNGKVDIEFSIYTDLTLTSWIVPAIDAENDINKGVFSENALINTPNGMAIRIIFKNKKFPVGSYVIIWDAQDGFGKDVPRGFYRIYFKSEDLLLWRDILIIRDPSDLPPDFPFKNWYG